MDRACTNPERRLLFAYQRVNPPGRVGAYDGVGAENSLAEPTRSLAIGSRRRWTRPRMNFEVEGGWGRWVLGLKRDRGGGPSVFGTSVLAQQEPPRDEVRLQIPQFQVSGNAIVPLEVWVLICGHLSSAQSGPGNVMGMPQASPTVASRKNYS
jgi:hypothetical protein